MKHIECRKDTFYFQDYQKKSFPLFRQLPVHPSVPTKTSPSFSRDFSSRASWKKGEQNILLRVPSFVSTTFLPKSSSRSVARTSLTQIALVQAAVIGNFVNQFNGIRPDSDHRIGGRFHYAQQAEQAV